VCICVNRWFQCFSSPCLRVSVFYSTARRGELCRYLRQRRGFSWVRLHRDGYLARRGSINTSSHRPPLDFHRSRFDLHFYRLPGLSCPHGNPGTRAASSVEPTVAGLSVLSRHLPATGCIHRPQMEPLSRQRSIDRKWVEYPAGCTLVQLVKGLNCPNRHLLGQRRRTDYRRERQRRV